MIRDARVLQDDHLPREVVHRHDEMAQLAGALEPVVDGDRPQHALLTGPSGAGKTCIARATLDRLAEQVLDVHTAHVDCWLHTSGFRVAYELLEGVGTTYDVHRSTPRDELIERLESVEKPYLAILDEADQLDDPGLFRQLYALPRVTMILVCNRERDLFDPLDSRLQSRLRGSEHVSFDAYTRAELVSILRDRAEWGLEPGAVTTAQLERMAEAAGGNARDAIGILRSAARRAERAGTDRIGDDDLEAAVPDAKRERRRKTLDRLSDHQLAIYRVLVDGGTLMPHEIVDRYADRIADPRSKRTVRTYLRKLEQYNLVESEGRGPSRVYSIAD